MSALKTPVSVDGTCSYPGCSCTATSVLWIVTNVKPSADPGSSPKDSVPGKYDDDQYDVDLAVISTSTSVDQNSSPRSKAALRYAPISARREWQVCEAHCSQLRLFLGNDLKPSDSSKMRHSGDLAEMATPPKMTKEVGRRRLSSISLHRMLICAASVLVFYNSFHGELCYDDHVALQSNPDVTTSGQPWKNDYWGNPLPRLHTNRSGGWTNKSFRPVTVLSFRLNYLFVENFIAEAIVGNGDDDGAGATVSGLSVTWPYHATNAILHLFVTLLVHQTALQLWELGAPNQQGETSKPNRALYVESYAFVAGIFFAVHPIHTEAVANITGRSELLSALFALGGLWMYDLPSGHPTTLMGLIKITLACTLIWLAGLSKESGLMMFVVFFLRDVLHLSPAFAAGNGLRQWVSTLCRFCGVRWSLSAVMAGIAIGFRMWLTGGTSLDMHRAFNKVAFLPTFGQRAMSYAYCQAVALGLLVWPEGLSYNHDGIEEVTELYDPRNLKTLGFWLATGTVAVWTLISSSDVAGTGLESRRRVMVATFAWGLLFASFLPASQALFPVGFLVAERTLYLPSVGFCMLVALLIQRCSGVAGASDHTGKRGTYANGLVAFVALCLATRTVVRNNAWKDDVRLRRAALRVYPNSRGALHGMGHYYNTRGSNEPNATALAEHYLTRAFEIDPTFAAVTAQLARLHFEKGELDRARQLYGQAAEGKPEFATNVGCLTIGIEGNFSAAEPYFISALHNNLGPADCRDKAFVLNNVGILHTHANFSKSHHDPRKATRYFREARSLLLTAHAKDGIVNPRSFKSHDHVTILRNLAVAAVFDLEQTPNDVRRLAEQARAAHLETRRGDVVREKQQRRFEEAIFAYLSANDGAAAALPGVGADATAANPDKFGQFLGLLLM